MNQIVYRMCVQTRNVIPRDQMLRIVVSLDQVVIDNSCEIKGRSIYIQNNRELISNFLKRKKLPLKLELDKQEQVRKILGDYINE